MKASAPFLRAAIWLNFPATILMALLQRTPALRVAVGASEQVLKCRAGELLRAAFTMAALGTMHSRAGATTFVQSPRNPVAGTVGVRVDVAFTYTGTPSMPARFQVRGSLPPGLVFIPVPVNGTIMSGTPVITGVPTQAGNFTVTVQGYNQEGLTNSVQQPINFVITGGASTAPTISAPPQSQSVLAGTNVTFSVQATGSPPPNYQWTKNGLTIPGATATTLALPSVQAADAGNYAVVVSNSAGTVTSTAATLTIVPAGSATTPTIVTKPLSSVAAPGSTVALTVVASGNPAPSYQWRRSGAALIGATDSTLLLPLVGAATAGPYSVVVSNGVGSVTSDAATLDVADGAARLLNLSVRANLGAGATLIVGFATSAARNVLIRGVGPTLGSFGVPSAYADPRLELYNGSSLVIGQNDDWAAALEPVFTSVGAFPLTIGSKDAAFHATAVAGAHSAHLKGPGSGVALVELYDSGAGTAVRLINVSARNFVGTDDNILIAGFVVAGSVARTLLIRAVGPTLAGFGVPGTLVDPKLEIFNSASPPVKVVENDNWSATLGATATSVGAFALQPGSRDAALVVTLPPGAYSAQVSGVARGTGEALIEVYEVP